MSNLYLKVDWDSVKNTFSFGGNVKEERITDILEEVICSHTGAGSDDRVMVQKDFYTIEIQWDLSDDKYNLKSNTGNHGLTTGILMGALNSREI